MRWAETDRATNLELIVIEVSGGQISTKVSLEEED